MKAKVIQLCGLPRSGTAWVSTLLNLNPDCMAFHELAAFDPNWRETLTGWDRTPFVADCSTTGFLPGAVVANALKVALVRDEVDAFKSAVSLSHQWDVKSWQSLVHWFQHWKGEFMVPAYHFATLFTEDSTTALWWQVFQRLPTEVELQKIRGLIRQNIQLQDPAELLKITPEREATLRKLLCHSD